MPATNYYSYQQAIEEILGYGGAGRARRARRARHGRGQRRLAAIHRGPGAPHPLAARAA